MKLLRKYFDEYHNLEQRLLEIEHMDKEGMSLDTQIATLDEYTNVWNRINTLNKLRY